VPAAPAVERIGLNADAVGAALRVAAVTNHFAGGPRAPGHAVRRGGTSIRATAAMSCRGRESDASTAAIRSSVGTRIGTLTRGANIAGFTSGSACAAIGWVGVQIDASRSALLKIRRAAHAAHAGFAGAGAAASTWAGVPAGPAIVDVLGEVDAGFSARVISVAAGEAALALYTHGCAMCGRSARRAATSTVGSVTAQHDTLAAAYRLPLPTGQRVLGVRSASHARAWKLLLITPAP